MKPGWSKPHTHSNPTNLALFRRKIALYRFNHGAHTIAGGAQMGAGGTEPPSPLTLTIVCNTYKHTVVVHHAGCHSVDDVDRQFY